jgi:hypothetical protein
MHDPKNEFHMMLYMKCLLCRPDPQTTISVLKKMALDPSFGTVAAASLKAQLVVIIDEEFVTTQVYQPLGVNPTCMLSCKICYELMSQNVSGCQLQSYKMT